MFDAPPSADPGRPVPAPAPAVMQRSHGRAEVALAAGGRLAGLFQQGAARAFLPRAHGPVPEVVFLNTSGGLTGGDRLSYRLDLAAGAAAAATTQTAERAYAAAGGVARLDLSFRLGEGAALDWLPQETILFDGAALHRATQVAMATSARLVWAEIVVTGRAAMGEQVDRLEFRDLREVRRGGQLALVEPFSLCPGPRGAGAALSGGARAFASVLLMAPGAEAALGPVRQAIAGLCEVQAAASAWDGRCVVRLCGGDALPVRRAVAAVLAVLRGGAALPRVWQL